MIEMEIKKESVGMPMLKLDPSKFNLGEVQDGETVSIEAEIKKVGDGFELVSVNGTPVPGEGSNEAETPEEDAQENPEDDGSPLPMDMPLDEMEKKLSARAMAKDKQRGMY